jgi:hypothetical protein
LETSIATGPEWWEVVTALGGGLAGIAALLTFLVAFRALKYARAQVGEAQKLRKEQAAPYVVVDLEFSPAWMNLLNLVIKNIGTTVAYDIRLAFDPPLRTAETNRQHKLSESMLLREGIPMMPPGKRFAAFFDSAHEIHQKGYPKTYSVTVTYRDSQGEQYEGRYTLDIAYLFDLPFTGEKSLHDLVTEVEGLNKTFQRAKGSHGALRVWVDDEAEWNRRQEEALEAARAEEPHDNGSVGTSPRPFQSDGT